MQSSALVRGFFACVPEIGHCGMNACMVCYTQCYVLSGPLLICSYNKTDYNFIVDM